MSRLEFARTPLTTARRALLMAGFWTILIFVAFRWLTLSGQGFNTGLAIAHLSAAAIGGFIMLLVVGFVLMHVLILLPPSWLVPTSQLRKWTTAVGLAVVTTGITDVTMWAMPEITVRAYMPLSVMLPHLIGGLIGWGLIQELVEIGGGE